MRLVRYDLRESPARQTHAPLLEQWLDAGLELDRALRTKAIRLEGQRELTKTFKTWFALSIFAPSGATRPA